ncbi:hypothetical protein BKA70DRAFT_1446635 [Coprinopsis sp. MPI-PUGE-AT-0042]|nr:hypothetical protein BKA70DRAFT_1446635 [Coprinopsis sp. MPI-PUGE-AT-0042]
MSLSIPDGGVYQISTGSYPGGSICTTNGIGELNLTTIAPHDEEKWIFHAIDNEGTYSIENFKYASTFIDVDPSGILYQETTKDPTTWFVREVQSNSSVGARAVPEYQICQDSTCSLYWVPTGPNLENTTSDHFTHQARQDEASSLWDIQRLDAVSPPESPTASSTSISFTTFTDESSNPLPTGTEDQTRELSALNSCAPCGEEECSFTPSREQVKDTYNVLIGQPVSNCAEGNTQTTSTTLGGTYELEQSWSLQLELGHDFGVVGPSVKTTAGVAGSKKQTLTQTIQVNILPGWIGGLVANISYSKQPGRVTIGKSELSLVAINPEFVLRYAVVYSKCSADFRALTLPQALECTTSGSRAMLAPFLGLKGLVMATLLLALGPLCI